MKSCLKLPVFLAAILTALFAMAITTVADETGFSANPVLPANQAAGVGGYFDLRVEPGQTQDLQVQVNNKTDKPISVTVEAITASTGSGGDVNYTSIGRVDETMRHKFAEIAQVGESVITVPPNSAQVATVTVTMPKEQFEGVVLGSIMVVKELTEEDYNAGNAIVNQYSYAIAVRLTETDAEAFPEPDFALGDVRPELNNGIAAVVCDLRNIQPLLVKGISVEAQILPKSGNKAIFSDNKPSVNMAPNSVYSMSLRDDAGSGLKPGIYVAKITMTYNGRDWVLEKEFTITADEAEDINVNSYNQSDKNWWIIALCIGIFLILVLLIIIFLLKKRRESDEYEKMMMAKLEAKLRRDK